MLVAAGLAPSVDEGLTQATRALDDGRAAQTFGRMVASLGGPADFVERAADYLPKAPVILPIPAREDGFVSNCMARSVGLAVVTLGGGRRAPDDKVDLAVGLTGLLPIGTEIRRGDPIGFVHARTEAAAAEACAAVQGAYEIGRNRPASRRTVLRRIAG